jgi:hypothetical protein
MHRRSYIRQDSMLRLPPSLNIVLPYFHSSMLYKLKISQEDEVIFYLLAAPLYRRWRSTTSGRGQRGH